MWWLGMKEKKQRLKNLLENGRMLQEQMIGFSNGKSNRIRTFTSLELQEATNDIVYSYIGKYMFYIPYNIGMYKISTGYFVNIPILVKKGYWDTGCAINDVVFASHMSVHKNVLKLLGVCLEEKIPFTVYECAEHRSLKDCLLMQLTPSGTNTHQQPPLPWKLRLKIAAQVANVVVYLHTAFSRPIVHRDINVSSILLDQQNVVKLFDFSLCLPIPEGEVRVKLDCVTVTTGYLAPEYLSTCSCSEKADVFNFGYLLLMLLTARTNWAWWDDEDVTGARETLLDRARRSVKDNQIADIVDPSILAEPFAGCPGKNQQLERFAELALSCAADREEDRPKMIDVEKQLWQMEQSTPNICGTVISEGMP